jgi:hypothetical protein
MMEISDHKWRWILGIQEHQEMVKYCASTNSFELKEDHCFDINTNIVYVYKMPDVLLEDHIDINKN